MTKSHVIDVPSKNIKNVPVCKFLEIRTFRVAPIQVKDCLLRCAEIRTSLKNFSYSLKKILNSFVPNAPFLYPLKSIRKTSYGFMMFSGGRERLHWGWMGKWKVHILYGGPLETWAKKLRCIEDRFNCPFKMLFLQKNWK